MAAMTTSNVQVRRATIEDVPGLVALWQQENLPWDNLDKRFKEFQVVLSAEGELLGGIGLLISGLEGMLHSEVFAHPEQADILRELLWQRFQILAKNHGLTRLWTCIFTPFWHQIGFQPATKEIVTRLPAAFANQDGPWFFLQLKDEVGSSISLDKEFALFKEAEKEQTAKLFRQARVLKVIATVLGITVFLLVIVWVFFFFKAQGHLPRH